MTAQRVPATSDLSKPNRTTSPTPLTERSAKPGTRPSGGKSKATIDVPNTNLDASPAVSQVAFVTQTAGADGELVPPTTAPTKSRNASSGGRLKATTNASKAVAKTSPVPDQPAAETHVASVGDELKATNEQTKPVLDASPVPDLRGAATQTPGVGDESNTSHGIRETQKPFAGVDQPPTTRRGTKPTADASGWLELRLWAEMLHDAQKSRIAASNRAERGGVDPDIYRWHVEQLETAEHGVALAMRRTYRRVVPAEVVAWQKEERGIGEHLLARLLGHLGDPYIARPHRWMETPPETHVCDPARCGESKHLVAFEPYVRQVSQLWSYCGVGDPLRKRRAGMTQEEAFGLGSPICKTLIHLLAEACMKQPNGNKYRDIYTSGREKYATRDDWKPGRQHNAALRLVKKELLRDLWLARHSAVSHTASEPRRRPADGTTLATGQGLRDAQTRPAGGDGLEASS